MTKKASKKKASKKKAAKKTRAKRPHGRPSAFTQKLADHICTELVKGRSLRSICRDENMPPESTVRTWAAEDVNGFFAQYARARDVGMDALADETLDIADDGTNDWMARFGEDDPGYSLNGEAVQRSRLRVDTRKWYLAKLAPKRYGDRADLNLGANDSFADVMKAIAGGKNALDLAKERDERGS